MSKEEKVEETTEEELETLGEAGLESEEDQDAASEADVEESEEVDERGVSYKNVAAEMKRKLDAANEAGATYKELIKELKTQKKEPTAKQIKELIDSVSDDEFGAENIAPSTAKLIKRAARAEAKLILQERENQINEEAKGLQERRKEQEQDRQAALHEVKDELSGEFGQLFQENGNWDTSSKIFKRTCEIYNNSAKMQGRATGQADAARKAHGELMKEKYGKAKPPKKTSKAESMKGGGSGRSGASTGKVKDSSGKFYRELSDAEFDKLDRQEQTKYLVVERQFVK